MKTTKFYQISRALVLSGLFFFSAQSFAQEGFELKGRIVNTTKQPIKAASATLTNSTTMETVAQVICDEYGEFVFQNVQQGEYILSVSKDGFSKGESRTILIDRNGNCIKKSFVMNDTKPKLPDLVSVQ